MGKLKIGGQAAKEYTYDQIDMIIRFESHADKSNNATRSALRQCEDFLIILEGLYDISNVRIGEDSVEQEYNYDEDNYVTATREIRLRLPFDMEQVNTVLSLIEANHFDVDVETHPRFTNWTGIHNDLIKMAIQDSESKAKFIAEECHQTVKGIDSIEVGNHYRNRDNDMDTETAKPLKPLSEYSCSDKLGAATSVESEQVEVVWIIE